MPGIKNIYRMTAPLGYAAGGPAGLYANIHAKRKRIKAGSGEKMRQVGSQGAPTQQSFIDSAKTAKKASGGTVITPKGFGLMLPNKKQTTTIY